MLTSKGNIVADLKRAEQALINASKAGDVESARKIANYLKSQREASKQDSDLKFSPVEMASNVPSSAAKAGREFLEAVTHPIETAKGVGKLAAGGLYKANEAMEGVLPSWMTRPIRQDGEWFPEKGKVFGEDYAPVAEAVGGAMKERYGSPQSALTTLEQDPVGALADLAGLLSGAGSVTRAPQLSRMGAALDPVNLGAKATSAAVRNAPRLIPEKLTPTGMYQSAAKFNTTTPSRAEITETALRNRIMPTEAGLNRLQGLIGGLNNQLDTLIQTAQETGQTVPVSEVFRNIDELRDRMGGVRLDAPQNLETIDRVVSDFRQFMEDNNVERLSAEDLQKLKTAAYERINFDARRQTGDLPREEAYKSTARAAKEILEGMAPGVRDVNQQLGSLYELQKYLPQKVARVENRDITSIGAPLKIMAGESVAPGLGTAIGTASAISDLPRFKARMAIEMRRTGDAARALANVLSDNQFTNALRQNPQTRELARILADPKLRQALIQSGRLNQMLQEEMPQ